MLTTQASLPRHERSVGFSNPSAPESARWTKSTTILPMLGCTIALRWLDQTDCSVTFAKSLRLTLRSRPSSRAQMTNRVKFASHWRFAEARSASAITETSGMQPPPSREVIANSHPPRMTGVIETRAAMRCRGVDRIAARATQSPKLWVTSATSRWSSGTESAIRIAVASRSTLRCRSRKATRSRHSVARYPAFRRRCARGTSSPRGSNSPGTRMTLPIFDVTIILARPQFYERVLKKAPLRIDAELELVYWNHVCHHVLWRSGSLKQASMWAATDFVSKLDCGAGKGVFLIGPQPRVKVRIACFRLEGNRSGASRPVRSGKDGEPVLRAINRNAFPHDGP